MAIEIKGSIQAFKGINAYCKYYDDLVEKAISENTPYGQNILNKIEADRRKLRHGDTDENKDWYGFPVPLTYEDAMVRRQFLNLNLYTNTYEELRPELARLEKLSEGILPKEVIRPTDREAGIFSLERAMMSIEPLPALYSKKNNKFYPVSDGEAILDKNGNQKKDKDDRLLFKLNVDGSEAILTEFEEDGNKVYGSSNKKSYLLKEKVDRPNRMVRLFVLIGANEGDKTYYAGLTAIVCATFLESKGYAVRITGVIGVQRYLGMKFNGKNGETSGGSRFSTIELKAYDETLDSLSLLYITADSSFFRIRQFQYFIAQQYKYNDDLYSNMGGMPSSENFRAVLLDEIKKRNIAEEKDVLYYYFGGATCVTLRDAKRELIRMVCDAENNNKEILQRLGYEFQPIPKDPNDIDCQ